MAKDDPKNTKQKMLELIQQLIQHDAELRKKYKIGIKFRFIPERLKELVETIEANLKVEQVEEQKNKREAVADEILVYVYLFNAHGNNIRNWDNMVTPKVFYEYSVNRPIYEENNAIESLIRSKKNKLQHAYLTVAIKPTDIIKKTDGTVAKDVLGSPLIKVKEGSLKLEKMIAFTHNEQNYEVNSEGKLTKKLE